MQSRALGWLKEPTLHFFLIGVLLFVAHRALSGDARTIVVTAGIRAHLTRRFVDQKGRSPTTAELTTALGDWKRDEALYREALRDGLEREDATIRMVLADKVRARVALELPKVAPSQAELDHWLETHESLYATPLRYDYELVTFAKTLADERALDEYEREIAAGKAPAKLGRPIAGGTLTAGELRERFGPAFAEGLVRLAIGRWQRFDYGDDWRLARVNRTLGGLPAADELRRRLIADWSRASEQQAVDRAVQQIVARYRFEERP